MILNRLFIKERLECNPPMVGNIKDLSIQLQPAGLDLTVKKIFKFEEMGQIDFDNSKRILPEKIEIKPNLVINSSLGYYLHPGGYQIELNETFNIPQDIVAFTISRSSLQRCGAAILTGFFDPGFCGNGVSLLNVLNKNGLFIHQNARICQIAFYKTNKISKYNGIYNIPH